jgi:hypothetical protein
MRKNSKKPGRTAPKSPKIAFSEILGGNAQHSKIKTDGLLAAHRF